MDSIKRKKEDPKRRQQQPCPSAGSARDAATEEKDPAVVSKAEPVISKDFINFEFSTGGSATMLPAD